MTIFWTVVAGFCAFVAGQLVVKLVIDPVQELNKTIGQISHALIEYASVYLNPGLPAREVQDAASDHLEKLSAQLQSHLYLVPLYRTTARVFRLPARENILMASKALNGLSTSVFSNSGKTIEHNAKRVERVSDSLRIYMPNDERWPED